MNRRELLKISGLTFGGLCLNGSASLFAATEKNAAARPFSFLLLGDVHFARPAHYDEATIDSYAQRVCRNTEESWDALWEEVGSQLRAGEPKPSFVLQLGDCLHGDCPTPEKSVEHYRDFVQDITRRKLPAPLFLTRGNHEMQGKGVRTAYNQLMPDCLKALAPETGGKAFYSFDAGPSTHVAVLDVYYAGGTAKLDREQLAWLEEDFTRFRERAPQGLLFVATHAPLFPITPRGAIFDFDPAAHSELIARFVKHQVNAVFCGHLHDYSVLTYRDPKSGHKISQIMTWALMGKAEVPAREAKRRTYEAAMIKEANWRKPEDLEAMRQIVAQLAPNVTEFRTMGVPGYQVVTVDTDRSVKITSYRGLGRRHYESFGL